MSLPAEIHDCVRSLVGPHVGVIEALERVSCEPDDIPLAVFAGRLCRTLALGTVEAPRTASGAALNEADARAACLGEAVERYAAALVAPGAIILANVNELDGERLTPDRFALFSIEQHRHSRLGFPFVQWKPHDRLGWARAHRLPAGERAWVPAALVHQPYLPAANEPLIAPTLSTGLASAADETAAKIAGLCEVIERDAVALAWLGRISPPRILVENGIDDTDLDIITGDLNARGFRWAAFDLTTDLEVPVAAALIEGHSSIGEVVSFGSACHPDRGRALRKALVEAAHCRMYVKSLCREEPQWQAGRRFKMVTAFADHARFYTRNSQHRRALDLWWHTPYVAHWELSCVAGGADETTLTDLTDRLSKAGYDAYCVNLTPPDVAEIGFSVVRILVPGLQPLHGNHLWPHLGGSRLRRLCDVFGPHARQPWRWNPWPHPCP